LGTVLRGFGLTGRGAFTCSTSPMPHSRTKVLLGFLGFGFGFGRPESLRPVFHFSESETFSRRFFRFPTSRSPRRSTNESTLVRFGTVSCCSPCGEVWTYWPLCCQQYASGPRIGTEHATLEIARRHGRPLAVRPQHVAAGFLESERARRDSGVRAMKGILPWSENKTWRTTRQDTCQCIVQDRYRIFSVEC
jgi:hypothetical protein